MYKLIENRMQITIQEIEDNKLYRVHSGAWAYPTGPWEMWKYLWKYDLNMQNNSLVI